MSHPKMQKKNTKSHPVSFRLPANYMDVLAGQAEAVGISVGEYARKQVIESLDGEFQNRLFGELAKILLEIQSERDDLATVAKAVIVIAGHQTPENAEEWIRTNLR